MVSLAGLSAAYPGFLEAGLEQAKMQTLQDTNAGLGALGRALPFIQPQGPQQYGGPGGSPQIQSVDTPFGNINVAPEAAQDFQGALTDLKQAGFPAKDIGSYNPRNIAGTNIPSPHSYGYAIDTDQTSRNVVSPEVQQWYDTPGNKEKYAEILKRHNLRGGETFRDPDFGHIEWTGQGRGGGQRSAPPGMIPGMAGQMDMGGMARAIMRANPGMRPEALGAAMQQLLPFVKEQATLMQQERQFQVSMQKQQEAENWHRAQYQMQQVKEQDLQDWRMIQMGLDPRDGKPATERIEKEAQAIIDYRVQPYTGYAAERPWGRTVMAKVYDMAPAYDATKWFSKKTEGTTAARVATSTGYDPRTGTRTEAAGGPEAMEREIKAIGEYRQKPYEGAAASKLEAKKIMSEVYKKYPDYDAIEFASMKAGRTAFERAVQTAEPKSLTKSLTGLTETYNNVAAFERLATQNGKVLIELANKVDSTGSPVVDRYVRAGQKTILGDVDVNNFHAQLQIWRTEVARIWNNPRLVGQLTDEARKEIESFAAGSMSKEQVESLVSLMERDFGIRRKTLEDQIGVVQGQLKSLGGALPVRTPSSPGGGNKTKSGVGWSIEAPAPPAQ